MISFRIIYEDDFLIAIDKPSGFHSHPPEDSQIRIHPKWDCVKILSRQIETQAFPLHRLDRATSGILLFSKNRSFCSPLQSAFREQRVRKKYLAVVRGHFQGEAFINRPLKNESGTEMPSQTFVQEILHFTLPIPGPRGPNRIFTIIAASPQTGRFHQIRRHLAGISLPIIGDSRHGDKKVNRAFNELTDLKRMYLRATEIEFLHPLKDEQVIIQSGWNRDWHALFDQAGICPTNQFTFK